MKALALTNKGLEEFCEKEIKEKIKTSTTKIKENCVFFEAKDIDELCSFAYTSQTSAKVLLLIDEFSFRGQQDLIKKASEKKQEIEKYISGKTFKVNTKRIGDHEFSSMDISIEIGKDLEGEPDFKSPEVIVYVFINQDEASISIDLIGFDSSKRNYKIFNHPQSIKGNVAFSLLMFAGYKKDRIVIDPFCGTGPIPIEAALYSTDFPVNYYNKNQLLFSNIHKFDFEKSDKKISKENKDSIFAFDHQIRHVNSTKKNAKIAGINKSISISKLGVRWLETKFDENSVDMIVTHPPQLSKNTNPKEVEKVYDEFFYQVEFVLKKKGCVAILSKEKDLLSEKAEKYNFRLKESKEVMTGKEQMLFLKFEHNKI